MRRAALLLLTLGAIVGAGVLVNSISSSDPTSSNEQSDAKNSVLAVIDRDVVAPGTQRSETIFLERAGEQGEVSVSSTLASETVMRLAREANGDDPAKRAAAINALGTAPKSLAVPVLQKVLTTSTDGDRQLALSSFRTLALDQGDADGIIRDTIRLTVYDGDEYVVADAQAVLEEIEHNLDGAVNGWH